MNRTSQLPIVLTTTAMVALVVGVFIALALTSSTAAAASGENPHNPEQITSGVSTQDATLADCVTPMALVAKPSSGGTIQRMPLYPGPDCRAYVHCWYNRFTGSYECVYWIICS